MSHVDLGIDTGGTFTDAVLLRDGRVIASAKALTTRHDLAIGITEAARAVLDRAGVSPDRIGFSALSTTLATNALVEGHGGRAGLVAIGFGASELSRAGLAEALQDEPVLQIPGGHNHAGEQAAPLDTEAIVDWAKSQHVDAIAVAARFATRNPAHENAARRAIQAATGLAVTVSHELSAKLGGPKRALTALLNARLIGLTHRLIGRAEDGLAALGITAPLMVVRGDGALMSAAQARERPIETILSGPAASIVGACWLTGQQDGFVADIGGTTTDIALIRSGRPRIDPDGARVGAFRTMVEAVAMRTHGLGGDSLVRVITDGLDAGVTLGPERVLPISLVARDAPEVIHAELDRRLQSSVVRDFDGAFLRAVPGLAAQGLSERQKDMLSRLGQQVLPMAEAMTHRRDQGIIRQLIARGLVQRADVTPTDAVHVLGLMSDWDPGAAEKALTLMARRRTGNGARLAAGPSDLAQMVVSRLTEDTALALLEAGFAEDDDTWGGLDPRALARHALMQRGLAGHSGLVRIDAGMGTPVIGLGASANCYYPAVGTRLKTRMILPEHAHVANAVGAVVGQITLRREGTVTSPAEGRFRAHLESGPQDFACADDAMDALEAHLSAQAEAAARAAGAADLVTTPSRVLRTAPVENREIFVEAHIRVTASGRPAIAG